MDRAMNRLSRRQLSAENLPGYMRSRPRSTYIRAKCTLISRQLGLLCWQDTVYSKHARQTLPSDSVDP